MTQLMNSVADDFVGYSLEKLIDPSQLIKIIRKINKQLGLRITRTKETIISFDNWILNLPDNMESLNFAVLCKYFKTTFPGIGGISTEHIEVDENTPASTMVYTTECGDIFQIVQKNNFTNVEKIYNIEKRIHIKSSAYQFDKTDVMGVMLSDNFMKLNIDSGKVYLNYEAVLEDDEGNLLVLDHPLVNDYYEYAIKERILENQMFQGEDVERKLAYLIPKLQMAKREAYGAVNMPEFEELLETNELNRIAFQKKYFWIFV